MATRGGRSTPAARAVGGAAPAVVPRVAGDSVPLEAAVERVLAARLRELRLRLGWSLAQLATATGLSKGMLSKIENGRSGPSLGTLSRLATALDVPLAAFFRGLQEESDVLLVKAGQGLDLSPRSHAGHRYQLLGAMRGAHQLMEPVLVTVLERTEVFPLYQHEGIELLYMVSGAMDYGVGDSTYRLEPGDSLQFDGEAAHGPQQLIQLPLQFLSVKAYGHAGK